MPARHRSRIRHERIRQRRRDDDGDEQGGHQRDDVRERQRRQQPSFDARQAEDWQKDEHDDDGGEHDGRADFECRVAHDLEIRPTLRFGLGAVLAKPPHDVLHVDDRIIDERPNRDRHPTERHRVDGRAEGTEHQNRRGE